MGRHDERIRAAMGRLLRGEPVHTNGELSIANLAREAGFVSRRPVYEAGEKVGDIVREFNAHISQQQAQGGDSHERHQAELTRLVKRVEDEQKKATKYREERDEVAKTRDAFAVAIAVLDVRVQRLEEALALENEITILRT